MSQKRRLVTKDNAERKRRRAEYMRNYCANMSEEQRSQIRKNNSQRHRTTRGNMTYCVFFFFMLLKCCLP